MDTFAALLQDMHHIHQQEYLRSQWLHVPKHAYMAMVAHDVNRVLLAYTELMMPKGKKGSNEGFGDTWFANIRLSAQDRAGFDNWLVGANEAQAEVVAGIILEGWKISLAHNSETDGYIAAATMKDVKNPNYGAVITSFSGDWYDALMTTAYKIIVLVGDTTIAKETEGSRWG